MSIYSTIDYVHNLGVQEGREFGIRESACRQLGKLLLRHGQERFGPIPQELRGRLDELIDRAALMELQRIRDRFLDVSHWTDLIDLKSPLPEKPDNPPYLEPLEVDPTPLPPSIDTYIKATITTGTQMVVHLRFQRLYQEDLGEVLYKESERLKAMYNSSVQTAVVLLWQGADGPAVTGRYRNPKGGSYEYKVSRMWEEDADGMFLGLGTAMFAPLGKFAPERLPEIIKKMEAIIAEKTKTEEERQNCWAVAYSSMGLRYPAEQVNELLKHKLDYILGLKESRSIRSDGFYEGNAAGSEEGPIQATRDWIIAIGQKRLGSPTQDITETLNAMSDLKSLESNAARVLSATSWSENSTS